MEWGSIADRASAIATFLVIVVSLRFASKQNKQRLKMVCKNARAKAIWTDDIEIDTRNFSNLNLNIEERGITESYFKFFHVLKLRQSDKEYYINSNYCEDKYSIPCNISSRSSVSILIIKRIVYESFNEEFPNQDQKLVLFCKDTLDRVYFLKKFTMNDFKS